MVVRQVVIQSPGRAWRQGVEVLKQPFVGEHISYLESLRAQGKIFMAGPFVGSAQGGMLVFTDDVSAEEAMRLATADPAAVRGLITFEIRPWYVTLDRTSG